MHPQRQIALVALSMVATVNPARSLLLLVRRPSSLAASSRTTTRSFVSSTTPRRMAAPGVEVSSRDDILGALRNPATTVIDARSVGELDENGYYVPPPLANNNNGGAAAAPRWIHAEATPHEAPLLQVAAEALLPDKDAPIVIYCGSGIRATTCKTVLEQKGYTTVLNAGGLADLNEIVQE